MDSNQSPVSTIVKITLPDVMKSFTTSFYTACATNVRSGNQEKELEALLNNLKPAAAQLVEAYNETCGKDSGTFFPSINRKILL